MIPYNARVGNQQAWTVPYVVLFGLVVTLLAFGGSFYEPRRGLPPFALPVMLPIFCGMIVSGAATIFQSNKNQLQMLYLQTDLPSKTAFLKTVASGWLWSVARLILPLLGTALAAHVFFPSIAWSYMFQLAFIVVAMALVQASIPLLTGSRRKTLPGIGWGLGVYFSGFPVLFMMIAISLIASSWIAAGVCVLVGVLIFYAALRRWIKSEMDCA
jgi:hypothetical protein